MFTGIIEKVGLLHARKDKGGMQEVAIAVASMWPDMVLGESVAIDGACLTVTRVDKNKFFVDISQPTFAATNLGRLKMGAAVNLERALKVGDRLGGHWVQGHVDGVGRVKNISRKKDNIFLQISASSPIIKHLISKGSVAVNGISLTVQALDDTSFTVVIVPHTFKSTTLSHLKSNDCVNIEVDLISKYIEKCVTKNKRRMSVDYLREEGF